MLFSKLIYFHFNASLMTAAAQGMRPSAICDLRIGIPGVPADPVQFTEGYPRIIQIGS